MNKLSRRQALALGLGSFLGAVGRHDPAAASFSDLALGDPEPFSFETLKERAATLAREPWKDARSPFTATLEAIDYTAFNKIKYRADKALWAGEEPRPAVQLFHLGKYFQEPCSIHVVVDGQAREILYRQNLFDIPVGSPARNLPNDVGFSGFRLMNAGQVGDWMAFLGASYFRASGELNQYGLSARGIAINTAMPFPEEFPRFSAFWLQMPAERVPEVTVFALLDGPSISGAYRMVCRHEGPVVNDIDCVLYPRRAIERLGVAPLTSMFWYSESRRRQAVDWRPEIHDSDGLAIWTGTGERIWRPLNNPRQVMTNSFVDVSPKGFGLLQRDRDFRNYQDDAVFYEKRPSLWVEPLGSWGPGEVQLVEIPTEDEIHDNIVAYWVPRDPVVPERPLEFKYRLHWVAHAPLPRDLARAAELFLGVGGTPGQERPAGVTKFVIDFVGGRLAELGPNDGVAPVVTTSRGKVVDSGCYPVQGERGRFRAFFDLAATGVEPIDLRLHLRKGDDALTETWLFQFFPDWDSPKPT
ncbi:glucan biosynthesis protein [Propylenella binzhouense]|uniref:Glucan biosynthesis protein D n=1 Tax=Propylenella binzhouense TaxID=2555902 RepID=A0A964WTZ8_9HYPH|nr:glucan biosynthesis protein D [Propylenella binzhouense]MYZ48335.1 glucan biosynthesis protein D [Propylenella binzhouense]